jgi:peptide deformylase
MAVREILLLGNPLLYDPSSPCSAGEKAELERIAGDLRDTLDEFRKTRGFGRAIAAPQIGDRKRMIYMFTDQPRVFINPLLTTVGAETMILWDDCMSFPGLLVKVSRYRACRLEYVDLDWTPHSMDFEGDMSELIQHEFDHLNGILAVQRAVDSRSFAMTSQIRKKADSSAGQAPA